MKTEAKAMAMAMAMACGGCSWKCLAFHSSLSNKWTSFFKSMQGEFSSGLEIPAEFAIRFKGKTCKDAILKGPTGHLWHVNMCCSDTSASFTDGWEGFVSDNGIASQDILVFCQVMDTYFVVQAFGPTGCKKQGSSSLKNYTNCCVTEEIPSEICNQKICEHRKIPTNVSVVFVESSKNEEIEVTNLTTHKEDCSVAGTVYSKDRTSLHHKPEDMSRNQVFLFKNFYAEVSVSPCSDSESDSEASRVLCPSEPMEPMFSVIIKKGAVCGSYRLVIPAQFAKLWLPKGNAKVILVHHKNPGMWPVILNHYTYKWVIRGGMWKRFVFSNMLHKQDRCIFKLVNKAHLIFMVYVTSGSLPRLGYNGASRCFVCKESEETVPTPFKKFD